MNTPEYSSHVCSYCSQMVYTRIGSENEIIRGCQEGATDEGRVKRIVTGYDPNYIDGVQGCDKFVQSEEMNFILPPEVVSALNQLAVTRLYFFYNHPNTTEEFYQKLLETHDEVPLISRDDQGNAYLKYT